MPRRKRPLVTGEIYHVFNRGVARTNIFSGKRSYERMLDCLWYYRFRDPPLKLSHFLALSKDAQREVVERLRETRETIVEVYSFCLMPNHFHLLLSQTIDGGISDFMRKAVNSYSTYFNVLQERIGPLLQGVFQAVRVESDEQLIHVSRYIHRNPWIGHVIKRNDLRSFPWSSLPDYLESKSGTFITKERILSYFSSPLKYEKFVMDESE